MKQYRRLPLEGLCNARELGGYPTPGGMTRYGVFVRTEVPRIITEADKQFLREYGIQTDIDLRGSRELARVRDALEEEPWLEYVHLPMYDAAAAGGKGPRGRQLRSREEFSWGEHYIVMAEDNKDWVLRVMTAMEAAKGGVMFHCTTGKDRTGIISAMLLGLCGVSEADIAADYSVSQIYLQPMYRQMEHYYEDGAAVSPSDPFYSTAPENILPLLRHVERTYGGMAGYLRSCGASEALLQGLKDRLV